MSEPTYSEQMQEELEPIKHKMNREEFFEWLNKCNCDYVIEGDEYGIVSITFYLEEDDDE
jgi:hypothetical protein